MTAENACQIEPSTNQDPTRIIFDPMASNFELLFAEAPIFASVVEPLFFQTEEGYLRPIDWSNTAMLIGLDSLELDPDVRARLARSSIQDPKIKLDIESYNEKDGNLSIIFNASWALDDPGINVKSVIGFKMLTVELEATGEQTLSMSSRGHESVGVFRIVAVYDAALVAFDGR